MTTPWQDPPWITAPDPRGTRGESSSAFRDPAESDYGADPSSRPPAAQPAPTPSVGAETLSSTEAAITKASALGQDLVGLKREIERALIDRVFEAQQVEQPTVFGADTSHAGHHVVGVGIGTGTPTAHAAVPGILVDDGPGSPSLMLYVSEPADADDARRRAAQGLSVHALMDTRVPVTVVATGIIDAYAHRMRLSPAPCGISVGHHAVSAGTLGALATSRLPDDVGKLLVLSNNHVIADSNAGLKGDAILQPGVADGGRPPGDVIARLETAITIKFGGTAKAGPFNRVDAAVGWAISSRVRRDFLQLGSSGAPSYFRVGNVPRPPILNLPVGKSGRTTQVTQGTITSLANTIVVHYGGGRTAIFDDQIGITGSAGLFSSGGDSGSLIWTWDSERLPVALLFAGGGGVTFANPIVDVLAALRIDLYT